MQKEAEQEEECTAGQQTLGLNMGEKVFVEAKGNCLLTISRHTITTRVSMITK
jgi:hypothetical protein